MRKKNQLSKLVFDSGLNAEVVLGNLFMSEMLAGSDHMSDSWLNLPDEPIITSKNNGVGYYVTIRTNTREGGGVNGTRT